MKSYCDIQKKFFYLLALSMWIFPITTDAQIQYPPQPGAVSFDHLTKPDGTPIEFTDGWTTNGTPTGGAHVWHPNRNSAYNGSENSYRSLNASAAITAPWWSTNPSGKGVYDPDKDVVVFKFSSLQSGNTTNTTNSHLDVNHYRGGQFHQFPIYTGHPTGAPILVLVDGDVTLNLPFRIETTRWVMPWRDDVPNGLSGHGSGPGAFLSTFPFANTRLAHRGAASSDGTGNCGNAPGVGISLPYGNARCVPMTSGGFGTRSDTPGTSFTPSNDSAWGAGGGLTIICSGNLHIGGSNASSIMAKAEGGVAYGQTGCSIEGNGGSLRLVATSISGQGTISVARDQFSRSSREGMGWIRVETYDNSNASWLGVPTLEGSNKGFIAVVPDNPVVMFPEDLGYPTLSVVSLNNIPAPAAPNIFEITDTNPAPISILGENTVEVIMRTVGLVTVDMGVYAKFNTRGRWEPADFGPSNLFLASELINAPFPDAIDPNVRYWTTGPVIVPLGVGEVIGMIRNEAP